MGEIILNIIEYRQEGNYLCWQAVTNIFCHYYKNEPYFVGKPGKDTIGDVMGIIELATDKRFHEISKHSIDGIRTAIKNNDLVYACLDYGNNAYHAAVIYGVGSDRPIFYLYDPEPRQYNSQWYPLSSPDMIYQDSEGRRFKIESLHVLR